MPRPEVPYPPTKKPERSVMLRRGLMLAAAFTLWMFLILGRLYYLQVIEYVHWFERAQRQQQRTIELAPQRGTIYDCRLHPLAMSLPVDSIYAVPSHLADPARAARLLGQTQGFSNRIRAGESFRVEGNLFPERNEALLSSGRSGLSGARLRGDG